MNTVKKISLFFLMLTLIFATIYLALKIKTKLSVNILDNKGIKLLTRTKSNYKYFYEISSNSNETDYISWLKRDVVYHHNNDSLNNINNYPYLKLKDTLRVAAIGDSFTYGFNVDTSRNWVSLMEQMLNVQKCVNRKFEVLNFGVPGYDIDYTIERNRIRAEKYHPDLYIWFIKDDDFSESKELLAPFERKLYTKGQYELKKYLKLLQILFNLYDKQAIIASEKTHLINYLINHPDTHFLIVFPANSLHYPSIDKKISDEIHKKTSYLKNIDFLSVDILQSDTFFPNDFHLNIQGNQKFSQIITNWVYKRYCEDR